MEDGCVRSIPARVDLAGTGQCVRYRSASVCFHGHRAGASTRCSETVHYVQNVVAGKASNPPNELAGIGRFSGQEPVALCTDSVRTGTRFALFSDVFPIKREFVFLIRVDVSLGISRGEARDESMLLKGAPSASNVSVHSFLNATSSRFGNRRKKMSTVKEYSETGANGREAETATRDQPWRPVEPQEEVKRSAEFVVGGFSGEAFTASGAVVLAILGLAGILPTQFAAIATIGIAAALLMKAGSVAARFSRLAAETGDTSGAAVELAAGMSTELMAGAAGGVLGVLALIGIVPMTLMAAAAIVFGGALLMGGGESYRVSRLAITRPQSATDYALRAAAKSSAGAETLVGIGAAVLGILALTTGGTPTMLVLVALLCVAGAQMLTGIVESGRMAKIVRS